MKGNDSNQIINDPRFTKGLENFNLANWYKAHDLLEELWHETFEPERQTIQGILQIAIAQLHLESGNRRGATILYGEGLGRLKKKGLPDLGIDLHTLCRCVEVRLKYLQQEQDPELFKLPYLYKK